MVPGGPQRYIVALFMSMSVELVNKAEPEPSLLVDPHLHSINMLHDIVSIELSEE